ncbi:MAG: Uma2 family endonuclease [Bryobacteraceae bacterium]|nr:Uma2 family endonuclease [Bryobacteraceae bacterium]
MIRLTARLFLFLETHPLGEALLSENLYAFAPDTRLAPDLAVILGDRRMGLTGAEVIPIVPDLAIEVLSPSETPARVHRKLGQYFRAGVREVWLIDPEDRSVEIWTGPSLPEHSLTGEAAVTSVLLPGFDLPLSDLFA